VQKWAAHLGADGFKIGIGWRGAASIPGRSFSLSALTAISRIGNVRLISLQKDAAADEIAASGAVVENLGAGFDAGPDGFLDSVAVMESLDLVITPDTSLAHLAGALGRPCWVALKYVPDWRWFLGRDDSPWYPQLRLFRQPAPGDWAGVFAQMQAQLHVHLS
jgi:hypothetical protein